MKLGKAYYGVTVTRDVGLVVEREDHAAKVVLNADELSFYKDSSKVLWFDPVNDRYEFNGHLQAASRHVYRRAARRDDRNWQQ